MYSDSGRKTICEVAGLIKKWTIPVKVVGVQWDVKFCSS